MYRQLIYIVLIFHLGCQANSSNEKVETTLTKVTKVDTVPDCEWCGAMDAPDELHWDTEIAGSEEKGERLTLSGTVYKPDGVSPAEGILIYAYHTNAQGVYPKRGDETGNGRRQGYLRAWVKTNEQGRYRFKTIRPAPYPSHQEPAHIHMTLSHDTIPEYWINSTWFEGDTLITDELISRLDRMGGFSNIIPLSKDSNGVWQGERNIILGK